MAVVSKMLEDREKKATVIVKKNGDDKYTVVSTIIPFKINYLRCEENIR